MAGLRELSVDDLHVLNESLMEERAAAVEPILAQQRAIAAELDRRAARDKFSGLTAGEIAAMREVLAEVDGEV